MFLRFFTLMFLLSHVQIMQASLSQKYITLLTINKNCEIENQKEAKQDQDLSPKVLNSLQRALDEGLMDQDVYCCGCFVQKLRRNDHIEMLKPHIRAQLNNIKR